MYSFKDKGSVQIAHLDIAYVQHYIGFGGYRMCKFISIAPSCNLGIVNISFIHSFISYNKITSMCAYLYLVIDSFFIKVGGV